MIKKTDSRMKSSDRLSLRWAARPPSVDKNRLALSGNAWVQTRPLGESSHIGKVRLYRGPQTMPQCKIQIAHLQSLQPKPTPTPPNPGEQATWLRMRRLELRCSTG